MLIVLLIDCGVPPIAIHDTDAQAFPTQHQILLPLIGSWYMYQMTAQTVNYLTACPAYGGSLSHRSQGPREGSTQSVMVSLPRPLSLVYKSGPYCAINRGPLDWGQLE
jgi:hypothetical protein